MNKETCLLSVSEQILHNIKQEYKRLQKRRHLDCTVQQADGCCPLDLHNIQGGSSLPGSYMFTSTLSLQHSCCCLITTNAWTSH